MTKFPILQDNKYKYYEVILVDPSHNAVRNVRLFLMSLCEGSCVGSEDQLDL